MADAEVKLTGDVALADTDRGASGTSVAQTPMAAHATMLARGEGAIELVRLRRDYGERTALEGVTLTLARGGTLVVFGPNGAGKTTLLRILATLLRPHGGMVSVLDGRLPQEAWKVRGRVGVLGHDPMLYRELSARENLRFHARLHDVGEERVHERLAAVGMAERADEPLRTLSRGMVQRVAVARATLHDPELLLLDEPYANLDPAAIGLVEPLIGAHGQNSARVEPVRSRTRVLTSHDPARGLAEADLALGLRAGRVALLAPAAEVDSGEIAELYR
jgi:heme ABC exporter ATP-binding subunit CcmA